MGTGFLHALPRWSIVVPVIAGLVLAFAWGRTPVLTVILIVAAALIAAVLAAVHHAEVVAHRVGEPFGTLILAVAVTVIEASLIVSIMISGGPTATVVARDSVYAAVMIILTGIVGVCLLVGGLRHHVTAFRVEGTSPVLAVLSALAVLTLVVPTLHDYDARPFVFAGAARVRGSHVTLALWRIRLRADGSPSRLLSADRSRR